MAFFDKVGETLTNFGNDVSNKTKSMMDISNYTNQLKTCQKTLNDNYLELGKFYFVKYRDTPDPEAEALFTNIREAQQAISHLNDAIRQSKGVKICSNCGAEVALNGLFCQSCGSKMDDTIIDDEEQTSGGKCPKCNSDIKAGAAFCEACGTKL